MLTAIAVILLVPVGILLLIAVALIAPVRVGFRARTENGEANAVGGVRIFGGLIGVGIRAVRKPGEPWTEAAITVGAMLWRTFVPLRRIKAVETPPTESDRDETGGIEGEELERMPESVASEPTPQPVEQVAETAPSERERSALYEEPSVGTTIVEQPVMPEASFRERLGGLREKVAVVRAKWLTWHPVARGVLRRLRGVVRLRRCRVSGTVGTGDPALTGQFVGVLAAMRGLENRAFRIRVAGDFDERTLDGAVEMEWRISLRRVWSASIFVGWVFFKRWWAERRRGKLREPVLSQAPA